MNRYKEFRKSNLRKGRANLALNLTLNDCKNSQYSLKDIEIKK